ncbi:MAG: hypothetical protein A2287_02335 [Candidatus Melainabacteria bacterium RIFOXYA12_FULL_32_12]|nr:MAG: hypothetical protein A2255_09780 [Candidatus Melainabacteria bacterium RIFOXYA2_FULL_32_9]OGI26341.1 MAG: hypothetical protein A2287_02335 [Candidatus Melainabacteria bacterium RIFOXYA12_FULL_32_12]
MEAINKLIEIIKKAKSLVILSHVGPDGDTLGSMLALKEILAQLGTIDKIDAIIVGKIPDLYTFLPGIAEVKNPGDKNLYQNYDLSITVDCGSIDRLGDSVDLFRNAKASANIDHHVSNTNFAQINWIEPKASSTGQILYKIIELLKVNLTKNIATNLYTAILTDTGGFKFENTKPETLQICAKLLEAGVDPTFIYKKCYESKTLSMVRLQARAVDQAVFLDDNKIAYASVTRQLLDLFGAYDDHVDGISETLRQVNTVEVALVFKETIKGDTKVSFRSNGLNVCEIARFFGGGGHKLAAGCTVQKNIPDSINEVLPIVKKQVSKLSLNS